VLEVSSDGAVREVWSGLTLVTALAVGPDGALYALEMATGIDPEDPASIRPGSGRVVRQTGPDSLEAVVTGLALPAAMAFGPDGALYVSGPAFDGDDGAGMILRIELSGGEPVVVPDVLQVPACP
jgi:hypothetical protein